MRKLILILTLALVVPQAYGAEGKIGYMDVQKAIQSTKAGKKARAELEKDFEKKKKSIQDKEKDLQKMQQDLEKKSMALSEEVKMRKEAEFRDEMLKYREMVGKSQTEIQARERDLTAPILEKLKKAVEKVAKDKELSIVLERAEHSVVWADSSLDITDEVVKAFEKL